MRRWTQEVLSRDRKSESDKYEKDWDLYGTNMEVVGWKVNANAERPGVGCAC